MNEWMEDRQVDRWMDGWMDEAVLPNEMSWQEVEIQLIKEVPYFKLLIYTLPTEISQKSNGMFLISSQKYFARSIFWY